MAEGAKCGAKKCNNRARSAEHCSGFRALSSFTAFRSTAFMLVPTSGFPDLAVPRRSKPLINKGLGGFGISFPDARLHAVRPNRGATIRSNPPIPCIRKPNKTNYLFCTALCTSGQPGPCNQALTIRIAPFYHGGHTDKFRQLKSSISICHARFPWSSPQHIIFPIAH